MVGAGRRSKAIIERLAARTATGADQPFTAPNRPFIVFLFPDGADWSKATYWAGLRPMTPTSLPIIGRSRHDNLWLNTGHGSLGWTLANGSGAALADLIAGRKPEPDVASFAPRN